MSTEVHEKLGLAFAEIAMMKGRLERMVRHGTVLDTDYSDPTKPRARIAIGQKDDGSPLPGPWMPVTHMAGDRNQWSPVVKGQQLTLFAPDGDHQQALLVHLGHSDKVPAPETDPNTHVDQHGQTKRTLKKDSVTQTVGGTQVHQTASDHRVTAPGKVEIAAGDPSAANSSGFGALGQAPHELNRQIGGIVARLDQHDHHVAALHDVMSQLNTIAQTKIPALASLDPFLLSKPENLKKAADAVQGKLPDYAAQAIQQTLGKLLNSPLSAVADVVQGDVAGKMGGLLGQVGALVGGAGLSGGAAATAVMHLGQAQAAISAAAAGGTFELDRALSSLTALAAGSPVEAMLGDAVGQLRSLMGSTSGLMGGLSGLLNGQTNAAKGTIKSALFGGY